MSEQPATARTANNPDRRNYIIGFVLAVVLTLVPFSTVGLHWFDRTTSLTVIGVCALAQIIVHFRFFLHIDLSASKREDLQLILFTVLIIIMLVGGSLAIMASLHSRMGMPI